MNYDTHLGSFLDLIIDTSYGSYTEQQQHNAVSKAEYDRIKEIPDTIKSDIEQQKINDYEKFVNTIKTQKAKVLLYSGLSTAGILLLIIYLSKRRK